MADFTAAMFLTPLDRRAFLPTHLLCLRENFRPVWTVQPLEQPTSFTRLAAGSPRNQLAVGLFSYLSAHHLAGLDNHPLLTTLLPSGDQEPARRLTTTDAHQIFRLASTAFRVDLTLYAGTCLTSRELEHAERCGLLIRTTDARRPSHQLSA